MVSSMVGGKLLGTLNFQISCLFLVTSIFLSPQSGFPGYSFLTYFYIFQWCKIGIKHTAQHTHWGNQNWKRHMHPMFIAALFIIAKTWKQPRCPSADLWIRKLWYIYTMECYSAVKKNEFESVLMRWMKLECVIQSEVSQKEKHQYSILMHIYGI